MIKQLFVIISVVLAFAGGYLWGSHTAKVSSNKKIADLTLDLSQLRASSQLPAAQTGATNTSSPSTFVVISPFGVMFPYKGAINYMFKDDNTVLFKSEAVAELALKADPNNQCDPATLGQMTRSKIPPANYVAQVGLYYYTYTFPSKCTNDSSVNAEAQKEASQLAEYLKQLKPAA